MSDQSENINCSDLTSKLIDNLLTLPIEPSTQPLLPPTTSVDTQSTISPPLHSQILQATSTTSCPQPPPTTMPSLAAPNVGTKSTKIMSSTTTTTNNDIGSISVFKKQPSPSTPSTAIDFFTFKWLFKKRTVPFLKKSSSSIFPEASETQSHHHNHNHHHGSNSVGGGISLNGNGLSGSRSNSRSAGSRLDCQSIPGTAKPTSKICSVTQPFISRLTESESSLRSTLRMKLSYSFGDIDDFSKWSNLDNGEREPLNPDSNLNDDHPSLNHHHQQHNHHNRHHSNVNSSNLSKISSSNKYLYPKSGKLTSSSSVSISHLPTTRRSGFFSRRESIGTMKNRDFDLIEKCFLCLNEISPPLMHTIWSCGCRFCINCLQTYLTINIKENNNVCNLTCPDSNCPEIIKLLKQHQSSSSSSSGNSNPISATSSSSGQQRLMTSLIKTLSPNRFTPQEIQLLVPEEIFNLYKKYKLYQEVDEDPNRTWCPKPNCVNICTISKPQTVSLPSSSSFTSSKSTQSTKMSLNVSPDLDKVSFYCSKCNETYCNLCRKSYHPDSSCWPSGEDDDLALLLNNQSGSPNRLNNIKRCPRCSVWIERDDGCAQMMCRKCKHVFCWFCLQSLEDDFLLRHYDKGPCKNKLGHSRPSVIWHRTQVIAIFAGFGLLLLLASPLFLIASPCILCCNCCCGSSCKYLDDGDSNEEEDGFGVVNL